MGSIDNDAFMEDFADSLNDEADPWQSKSGRHTTEALDTSLQAPSANDFSNARLIEEVGCKEFFIILICFGEGLHTSYNYTCTVVKCRTRQCGNAAYTNQINKSIHVLVYILLIERKRRKEVRSIIQLS